VDPERLRRWEDEVARCKQQHKRGSRSLIASKTLRIKGPRHWRSRSLLRRMVHPLVSIATLGLVRPARWYQTRPQLLSELPLRYEHSWGGSIRHPLPDDKELHFAVSSNPVGKGFFPSKADIRTEYGAGRWAARKYWNALFKQCGKQIALPLIEDPKRPVTKFGVAYPVEGCAVVTKAWDVRLQYAGTFDAEWDEHKKPFLPDDFQFRYWNGAHPDLQLPYLHGDEHITLTNMRVGEASGVALQLPSHSASLLLEEKPNQFSRQNARLDTVIINLELQQLQLLWRAAVGGTTANSAEVEFEGVSP
jgi:hypothetical protein